MKSRITTYLTLIIGILTLLAVAGRVYYLYTISQEMIHTTATIVHIDSEKVYRPRKNIYKHTAILEYKVNGYTQSARTELYNPFVSEGSTHSLWYHPSHTHKFILPSQECFLLGVVGLFGLFFFLTGVILLKSKE